MRIYDIIKKKRDGGILTKEEIEFFVTGYTNGQIPDYQASALLMAIFYKGMTDEETACLTLCMSQSGDTVNLTAINGITVDKHSTGGVGDKTTLIIAPLVASLGVKVAKMSGRGLGHTGGTIDKLESIKGYQTSLDKEKFFEIVNDVGVSVIGQSGNLAPADKKLYALRDVTATVDCVPLIVSSIMSKKLASGSDAIVLDVKCGSGAFMKNIEDAEELANAMVRIGKLAGKKMIALITDMSIPLGRAIGNSLEVMEAVEVLKGKGEKNLTDVCIELASNMLFLADFGNIEYCRDKVKTAITDGSGFLTLKNMVKAHGGNSLCLDDFSLFDKPKYSIEVPSLKKGYISSIDAEKYGLACLTLGAGRAKKEDTITHSAGIYMNKTVGDFVEVGETLLTLYTDNEKSISSAKEIIYSAIEYSSNIQMAKNVVLERIV